MGWDFRAFFVLCHEDPGSLLRGPWQAVASCFHSYRERFKWQLIPCLFNVAFSHVEDWGKSSISKQACFAVHPTCMKIRPVGLFYSIPGRLLRGIKRQGSGLGLGSDCTVNSAQMDFIPDSSKSIMYQIETCRSCQHNPEKKPT